MGIAFLSCRKALTLLNTGNGVFKESTVFEVRYTGIQGNEQKEPVLAAYYNSLHYFVTTACFRHTTETNFWNSKIIVLTPKLILQVIIYKYNVAFRDFTRLNAFWMQRNLCLNSFILNVHVWWCMYGGNIWWCTCGSARMLMHVWRHMCDVCMAIHVW